MTVDVKGVNPTSRGGSIPTGSVLKPPVVVVVVVEDQGLQEIIMCR